MRERETAERFPDDLSYQEASIYMNRTFIFVVSASKEIRKEISSFPPG